MDINRHGALRYRGTTDIISNLHLKIGEEYDWKNNVRWDISSKQIVINAGYVPHQDGVTHHNYQICLSLEDVAALVTLLGHASSEENAVLLRDLLGANIPALVKLLACATGLVPVPLQEKNQSSS